MRNWRVFPKPVTNVTSPMVSVLEGSTVDDLKLSCNIEGIGDLKLSCNIWEIDDLKLSHKGYSMF